MALMCHARVAFESIELSYLIKVHDDFKPELDSLTKLQGLGLCTLEPGAVQVTATGGYFVRAVARVFDRHLRADRQRERFSRII